MSELGFNTDWKNPCLPSAEYSDLAFPVLVETACGTTVFSRHATAQEAWDQASFSNTHADSGQQFWACDEAFTPLTEGYFRKTEERFENMTADLIC